MDYKELIGLLGCRKGNEVCKSSPVFYGFACDRCRKTIMQEAAAAIETLLAERETAVEELRGMCWCCAHGKPWEKAGSLSKLTGCEHLSEIGVLARGGGKCKCPYWEWHGLKKGDGRGG